jgi:hypothetical protein
MVTLRVKVLCFKGSQIMADGLETDPIVFSSNRGEKKGGDWVELYYW